MSDSFLLKFDYTFRPGPEFHLIVTKLNCLFSSFKYIYNILKMFLIILKSIGKIQFINNIFVNFKILFCFFVSVLFL